MRRCLLLILLVLAGCKATVPVFKPLVPPMLPKIQARAMAVPLPAKTNFFIRPVYREPALPAFKLPVGWETNHWRLMRSSDLVHWGPVMGWARGLPCAIFLEGERCYLRLESYIPPVPPVHIPDSDLKDE